MKPHPAQPDEAPALDTDSPAIAWVAASVALLMTATSLLGAVFF